MSKLVNLLVSNGEPMYCSFRNRALNPKMALLLSTPRRGGRKGWEEGLRMGPHTSKCHV